MIDRFEKLRIKLHISIEKYGLNSKETAKISKKFDELVNTYYENERQYSQNNIIYTKCVESVELLRNITRNFSKYPTIEEWNKYAKEKNLLCSESIKYITGINWHELRSRIKSEI